MPQLSKVIEARQKWKDKAIQKSHELREEKKAKKYYQQRATLLYSKVEELEKELKFALVTVEDKKKLQYMLTISTI